MKWLSLAAGGILGTFARYLLSGWIYNTLGTAFPYGTLTVNLLGCFLVGIFAALAATKFSLGADAQILVITGFCGAFTTFSAFILETGGLIRHGDMLRAFVNVAASLILGFVFLRLGLRLGELF